MTRSPLILAALLATFLFCACSEAGDPTPLEGDEEQAVAVLPGKADDYLSPTSQEYRLWAISELSLDEEWADKDDEAKTAHAESLLAYKFKAYAHFINVYVTDKGHHDENKDYGGFAGLVRKTTLDYIIDPVDDERMTWVFLWELEMGGPRSLIDDLPIKVADDGALTFEVTLPVLSESQLTSGAYPQNFDPATYTGDMETIEVVVEAIDKSFDAYPEYTELFEDDKLDVLILVGGDYNDKRYDLRAAEEIFDWLKSAGYAHEAEEWTELTLESPPFTDTIDVEGREVAVEITLWHPAIVEVAKLDDLRAKIITAYETMDVVLYDGHAGQDPDYSGVVYHYKPRHAISANDLATLDLPEKYQMYVFNGCKTYSAYPEAVYKHEGKDTANLDIISTVNFSWLSQQTYTTSGFLDELLALKNGQHDPRSYLEILSDINKRANHNVYYGVHGLDDNPHANPYGDPSTLCDSCDVNSECPGNGNRCVALDGGLKACAMECTADDGCPEGYACLDIAVGAQISGRQCLPVSLSCE